MRLHQRRKPDAARRQHRYAPRRLPVPSSHTHLNTKRHTSQKDTRPPCLPLPLLTARHPERSCSAPASNAVEGPRGRQTYPIPSAPFNPEPECPTHRRVPRRRCRLLWTPLPALSTPSNTQKREIPNNDAAFTRQNSWRKGPIPPAMLELEIKKARTLRGFPFFKLSPIGSYIYPQAL
jgi:hypothetical protein